jgi:hypothetical protein
MANLRGSTFNKQVENAFFRILKYNEGRHNKNDNFTHSVEVAKKREMYLNDFKNFIQQNKGIKEGKLNTFMNQKNVKEFIKERTINLSPKSSLDYVTGFNSLLKGLEQSKVTIPAQPSKNNFLRDFREQFREEMRELKFKTGRYINNLEQKLDNLQNIRNESYVVAKLQSQTGLRVAEAMEVVKNFEKYYNQENSTLNGVIGKGNHMYQPKEISNQLALEIKKMENIPNYKTYSRDLKNIGIPRSHDLRLTYAKNLLDKKLEQGVEYKEALKEVSKEINHHRAEITKYYLRRV